MAFRMPSSTTMPEGSPTLLDTPFHVAEWRVEPNRLCLSKGEQTVQVSPKVMQVLCCLAARPGEVVTREELLETVWSDTVVGTYVLTQAISELRKVFEDDAKTPRFIETILKTGYRLLPPVVLSDRPTTVSLAAQRPTRYLWAHLGLALLVIGFVVGWSHFSQQTDSTVQVQEPTPLTTFSGLEFDPAFSPDGASMAFAWTGSGRRNVDIYIKQMGTEHVRRLTHHPGFDLEPTWSPDGSFVAFARINSAAECTLHIAPTQGGDIQQIGHCGAPLPYSAWVKTNHNLAWSPDGRWLAYAERPTPTAPYAIMLLSLRTHEKQQLTYPSEAIPGDHYPVFSPDGNSVSFIRDATRSQKSLFTVPVSGGPPIALSTQKQNIWGHDWAPDGETLLFSAFDQQEVSRLWRISAKGGTPHVVPLAESKQILNPTFAGKHARLVYEAHTLDMNIKRVALPGSLHETYQPPSPVFTSTRTESAPQFSADGERVAFLSSRTGHLEIWTATPEGTDAVQVTHTPSHELGTFRWAHHTRALAFVMKDEDGSSIYVVPETGGTPRRLTDRHANDAAPSWSSDDQWIYFGSQRSGAWQVWKVHLDSGDLQQITHEGGYAAHETPGNPLLYFTKRNTPGVWAMPSTGGPAERVLPNLAPGDWGNWALFKDGLYFLDRRQPGVPGLSYLDFDTHQTQWITRVPGDPFWDMPLLSISPDQKWLLYASYDRHEADLMWTEARL